MTATTRSAPVNRPSRDLGKWLTALWSWLVVIFLLVPIVFVVVHSFNGGNSFNIWKEWGGLKWYRSLIEDRSLRATLVNSFKAAIGSTLISVVIGALAGVALVRRPGKWVNVFMLLLFLVMVTPEVIDGFALLSWFFDRSFNAPFLDGFLGIRGGMLRLWIGHSLFSSAVVTLIVRARLQGLDESLEEAAADLGATPRRAFFQITLPLMAPALLAGAMLAFSFSLDNVIISSFVGQDSSTFPLYLLGTVKSSTKPNVGAGGVLLFLTTLLFAAVTLGVLRRSGDSSSAIAATVAGG